VPSTKRRYRQRWALLPALVFSALLQGGAFAAYEVMQPEPLPKLRIVLESESEALDDAVIVSDERGAKLVVCTSADKKCRIEVAPGTKLFLDALPGTKSTFLGWDGCEVQADVLHCQLSLDATTPVTVKFGVRPEEVNVAMLDTSELAPIPDLNLPELPEEKTLEEIEAEKLEEAAVEVAIVPPLPPDFVPPPLPPPLPPPPAEKPKTAPQPPPPEMRMVEVPDENIVENAPDDAAHLSDKNRDVAEETAARESNLEKELTGEAVASAPSEDTSDEIGGPDDLIRQTETSESESMDREEISDRSGESDSATGAIVGEEGEDGEDGEGADDQGAFAMRNIEGRGSVTDQGDDKKKGKKGKAGIRVALNDDDYERIVGKERAEKEREIAQRKTSTKRGRYKKKLEAIKSALENFTPDVRIGNQTALKTRANPFAVYIARMHRRIHELWGFGFLEDLDGKSSTNELNNFDLFVSIEMSINPDGTVFKTTIAKGSGELEFDVAALDTVLSGAPYETTPEEIRSVDGRVYLRWGFYRNWRQCGTFNVEPYILTDIPGGIEPLPDDMDKSGPQKGTETVTPEPTEGSGADGEDGHDHGHGVPHEAEYAANMWIAGFSSASTERMVKVTSLPFYAGGEVAAQSSKELPGMYEALIVESGAFKTWELLTPEAYSKKVGAPVEVTEGSLIMIVNATETFAIVFTPNKAGEYRATQLVR